MIKNKPVAYVDLDHTLVNWDDTVIEYLKSIESPSEKGKYDYSGDIWEIEKIPGIRNRLNLIMSKKNFWNELDPIESGMQLYMRLVDAGFEVCILTKATIKCSLVWEEKIEWIRHNLGDVEVNIVSGTKGRHLGDLLVDDFVKNAEEWILNNPNGHVIVPIRKSNKNYKPTHPNIHMWDDSPVKEYVSDFGEIMKTDYNFSLPNRIIKQIVSNTNELKR